MNDLVDVLIVFLLALFIYYGSKFLGLLLAIAIAGVIALVLYTVFSKNGEGYKHNISPIPSYVPENPVAARGPCSKHLTDCLNACPGSGLFAGNGDCQNQCTAQYNRCCEIHRGQCVGSQ